jgi:hypothetical protein
LGHHTYDDPWILHDSGSPFNKLFDIHMIMIRKVDRNS